MGRKRDFCNRTRCSHAVPWSTSGARNAGKFSLTTKIILNCLPGSLAEGMIATIPQSASIFLNAAKVWWANRRVVLRL